VSWSRSRDKTKTKTLTSKTEATAKTSTFKTRTKTKAVKICLEAASRQSTVLRHHVTDIMLCLFFDCLDVNYISTAS